MSSSLSTPADAAAALHRVFPPAISSETLAEYGLSLSVEQRRRLTEELLALSLFWARCALEVILTPKGVTLVMEHLHILVHAHLVSAFGEPSPGAQAFPALAEARRIHYRHIVTEGAAPVAVASEVAAILEHEGIVPATERTKALALLLDQTPVDELGELAQEIELQ